MKEIKFVDLDVEKLEETLKSGYEEIMGVHVRDGDPVNDFIQWVAYVLTVASNKVNYTGKMNLLKYAKGNFLEAIGELVGAKRNQEARARTRVKYTFSKIFDRVITIPAGHKVGANELLFELTEDIELKIGEREVTGEVVAITPGLKGNGLEPGEVNSVVDDFPYLLSVTNLSTTNGGAAVEEDESLRKRIRMKPQSFSTAGPVAAYKYYVFTAHQDIVDVEAYTPKERPGVVKIYPLMKNGVIPENEVLEKIDGVLKDDVRPFTDKVEVEKPSTVTVDINFKWWAKKEDDVTIVQENVAKALVDFERWQEEKLGRDINPNKLVQLLIQAGVKRVEIISPTFQKIDRTKVAQISRRNSSYQGVEDE